MVTKKGQRKFLLKCGYTDDQLDHMSPSAAHSIISEIEKREHPQGCKNSAQVNQKEMEYDLFQVGRDCIMCKHSDCIIDFEKMSEKLISLGWHKY